MLNIKPNHIIASLEKYGIQKWILYFNDNDIFLKHLKNLLSKGINIEIVHIKKNVSKDDLKIALSFDKDIIDISLFENSKSIEEILTIYLKEKNALHNK